MRLRLHQDLQAAVRDAEALLRAGRTAEQRRLERLATADRRRQQAEQPEHRSHWAALLETARTLEERAGRAPLRLAGR